MGDLGVEPSGVDRGVILNPVGVGFRGPGMSEQKCPMVSLFDGTRGLLTSADANGRGLELPNSETGKQHYSGRLTCLVRSGF